MAEQACEKLRSPEQRAWLDRLSAEQPNLRAALTYTVTVGEVQYAWRLVAALCRFWDHTGQRREAQDWIQRVLAIGDPPATSVTVAGLAEASLILQASDSRVALGLARRAAQLAAGLDDFSRAHAALAVGRSAIWVQPELVLPALRDAVARFGADHPWECAMALGGPRAHLRRAGRGARLGAGERGVVPSAWRSHVGGQHAVRHGTTVHLRWHRR